MEKLTVLQLLIVSVFLCGCATRDNYVERVGKKMDLVERAIEEYGSVSVASPLLVAPQKLPKDGTGFSLKKGPDDYYEDARTDVQGGVSTFFQQAGESRTGLQFKGNIENFVQNQLAMGQFQSQQSAFQRRVALGDSGRLLNVFLPLVDPKLSGLLNQGTAGGTNSALLRARRLSTNKFDVQWIENKLQNLAHDGSVVAAVPIVRHSL